jgi:hypothetical protein
MGIIIVQVSITPFLDFTSDQNNVQKYSVFTFVKKCNAI